jgi:mono/diheme cytochrome c family protein
MRNLLVIGAVLIATAGAWAQPRTDTSSGFFSAPQATRGKALFATACAACHTADAAAPAESEIPKRLPIALAGSSFLRKWATTGDLFSKVSTSMPVDRKIGVAGMKHAEYVDIVAFLLQVNGLAAGRAVPSDPAEMREALLSPGSARLLGAATTASTAGYYTVEQAERGRLYFYGSCNTCHIADARTWTPDDLVAGRGFLNGRGLSLLSVNNPDRFAERWQNVARLYNKVRTTMPGHDAGGLSTTAYLGITAYILNVNQIPPGSRELQDDLPAMRAMRLPPSRN